MRSDHPHNSATEQTVIPKTKKRRFGETTWRSSQIPEEKSYKWRNSQGTFNHFGPNRVVRLCRLSRTSSMNWREKILLLGVAVRQMPQVTAQDLRDFVFTSKSWFLLGFRNLGHSPGSLKLFGTDSDWLFFGLWANKCMSSTKQSKPKAPEKPKTKQKRTKHPIQNKTLT